MNADDDEPQRQHWTLDKRVQLPMLIAIAGQLTVFVWWGAKLDATVINLGERVGSAEREVIDIRRSGHDSEKRAIRIEEKMQAIADAVRRIDAKLDGERGHRQP